MVIKSRLNVYPLRFKNLLCCVIIVRKISIFNRNNLNTGLETQNGGRGNYIIHVYQ